MSRLNILLELRPNALLELTGELDSFDRGGRIRIYKLCTEYDKRIKQ